MGCLCEFISVIRVLQCSLGMPASAGAIPFFVMFGRSTMGLRGQFVLLRGFAVFLVYNRFSSGNCSQHSSYVHLANQSVLDRELTLASHCIAAACSCCEGFSSKAGFCELVAFFDLATAMTIGGHLTLYRYWPCTPPLEAPFIWAFD